VGMKKSTIDMGNYLYSTKELEAYMWCVRNNILISPRAISTNKWYIDIDMNKRQNTDPVAYGKVDIWKQIFKYYTYYYEKYKK
jgi:hypothetical protein